MAIDHLKHRLVGQAPLNDCNDVMEKSKCKSAEIYHRHGTDIESPLSQNSTGSEPNQHYHLPTQSPNQSPRRRGHSIGNRHRRLCSVENIAYVIFFLLLVVYISLQIMIATIHLDSGQATKGASDLNADNTNNDSIHFNPSDFNTWWSQVSKKTASQISKIVEMIPSTINNYVQRSEDGYILIFQILLAINVASLIPTLCSKVLLKWNQTQHQPACDNDLKQRQITHNKLLYRTYLPVYLLATCADWLQGPYKYALYSSYGYSQQDIAHLFVAGYGSGMFLGSIVGGLADQYGRKKLCLCYCLCYLFSVLMKHCKNFYMLLLGRVGGGIATSLLFSVFESWLIGAHIEKGLTGSNNKGNGNEEGEKWLAKSFSFSAYGSSLVAISSGVLANVVVENSGKMKPLSILGGSIYVGGYIAAFDACIVPLMLCAALIMFLWDENYGVGFASNTRNDEEIAEYVELVSKKRFSDSDLTKKHSSVILDDDENVHVKYYSVELIQPNSAKVGLMSGVQTVWNSPTILTLCIIASTFEGSMYIFIFLWTPALTHIEAQLRPTAAELPFGWIFASFMLCCLLGTISFSRLSRAGVPASKSLVAVLALAAMSCLAMACPDISGSSGASSMQYWGMLCYEFAIGAYYPAISVLKGTIVPEDQRATIYNVFRLPLNLLVLINLTAGISTQSSFLANTILLTVACILQIALVRGMNTKRCSDLKI